MFVYQQKEQSTYSDGGLGPRSRGHRPVSDDGAFASARGRRGRSVIFQTVTPLQAQEEEKKKRDVRHISKGSAFASARRRAVVFQTIAPLQELEDKRRAREMSIIFETEAPLQAPREKVIKSYQQNW